MTHLAFEHLVSRFGPILAAACLVTPPVTAANHPGLAFDRLATGFVAEAHTADGVPAGTGFAAANPWGQYTAYLMFTDVRRRRTWRLEHNLPNVGAGTAQGSTMYLLEGSSRALLIDTANPAQAKEGVNDLKTVVRYLLAHDNVGKLKLRPLDYVVANTHGHPDHVGENRRMSDRTVYFPDGDWPVANIPPNYVPIREGGGPTSHGGGVAVGEINLGGRVLKAIDVPPHSNGSQAYFDADNQFLFGGDAIGAGWPFLQRGPMTQFAHTMHHLVTLTAPYPKLVLFPAHYFLTGIWDRAHWSAADRVLDRQYVLDMAALADGVVAGQVIGTPFPASTHDYWAVKGKAKLVYNLDTIGRHEEASQSNYHIVEIPGGEPHPGASRYPPEPMNIVREFAARTFLIRGPKNDSFYLVRGSKRAILIGTGAGAPGLAAVVSRLCDGVPFDVALMDDDLNQTGGLAQLAPVSIFAPGGAGPAGFAVKVLRDGDIIDLGANPDGSPLRLEAQTLDAPGHPSLTLLSLSDRALFVGNALGDFALGSVLQVAQPLAFAVAVTAWSNRTYGRFSSVYAARSSAWFGDPAYVGQLQQVMSRAVGNRGPGQISPGSIPGTLKITAEMPPRAALSIVAPTSDPKP